MGDAKRWGPIEIDAGDAVAIKRDDACVHLYGNDGAVIQIEHEDWPRFFAACVAIDHIIVREREEAQRKRPWLSGMARKPEPENSDE